MKAKDLIEILSDIPLDSDIFIVCGDNEASPNVAVEPISRTCNEPIFAYVLAASGARLAGDIN